MDYKVELTVRINQNVDVLYVINNLLEENGINVLFGKVEEVDNKD